MKLRLSKYSAIIIYVVIITFIYFFVTIKIDQKLGDYILIIFIFSILIILGFLLKDLWCCLKDIFEPDVDIDQNINKKNLGKIVDGAKKFFDESPLFSELRTKISNKRIKELESKLKEAELGEKLETTIFKEKAEQAKYKVNRAEAEEAIAKIKKRVAGLFTEPKKEMTEGERFLDRERRIQEFIKAVKEASENLPQDERERFWAKAYQEIEKIK